MLGLSEALVSDDLHPYKKCINILKSLELEEFSIDALFEKVCGDLSAGSLKAKFSEKEIQEINGVLEWYHLLLSGCLPECSGYIDDISSVTSFLGVNSCIEILNTKNIKLGPALNPFSYEKFLAIISTSDTQGKENFQSFLSQIAKSLTYHSSTDVIVANLELLDFSISQKFKDTLNTLNADERLRWAIFISIILQFHENEFILRLPNELKLSDASLPMHPYLKLICEQLAEEQIQSKSSPLRCAGGASNQLESRVSFAKLDIPGLPNWMPNARDSCYISATLWPLFLLIPEKIEEKICSIAAADSPEKPALEAFKNLYLQIAAKENIPIARQQVNDFRRAMQKIFPNRFIAPHDYAQEDAYEFLGGVLKDLLELDYCKKNKAQFHVLHTFEPVDEAQFVQADLYDYTQALNSFCREELSYILDIPLENTGHILSLKDLITSTRQTGELERNAYLKDTTLPKQYKTVITHHKEKFLVESYELAPDFFCGRITRFSTDYVDGVNKKRFDCILADASLEFQTKDPTNPPVAYDLVAITIHSGPSINAGHYYTYFRHLVAGEYKFFKYDDIHGPELCANEKKALEDAALNGYIYYYKKRASDAAAPPEFAALAPITSAIDEAKNWVMHNLLGKFIVDEKKGSVQLLESEAVPDTMNQLADSLKRPVYLIDPTCDNELLVLDDSYPIPGDPFRFGEIYPSDHILYMFKQSDFRYVKLSKLKIE